MQVSSSNKYVSLPRGRDDGLRCGEHRPSWLLATAACATRAGDRGLHGGERGQRSSQPSWLRVSAAIAAASVGAGERGSGGAAGASRPSGRGPHGRVGTAEQSWRRRASVVSAAGQGLAGAAGK